MKMLDMYAWLKVLYEYNGQHVHESSPKAVHECGVVKTEGKIFRIIIICLTVHFLMLERAIDMNPRPNEAHCHYTTNPILIKNSRSL